MAWSPKFTFSVTWDNVSGKPATATRWPTWNEVTDKPSTFTPSSHTHTIGNVTGLQSALDGKVDKGVVYLNDLNDAFSTGMSWSVYSPGAANAPDGLPYGSVLTLGRTDVHGAQLVIRSTSSQSELAFRGYAGEGVPSDWFYTWHTGNFDPDSKADTSHTHSADDITSGVISTSRLPFLQGSEDSGWARLNASGNSDVGGSLRITTGGANLHYYHDGVARWTVSQYGNMAVRGRLTVEANLQVAEEVEDAYGDVRKLKGRFSDASTTITESDLNGVVEKRSSGGNHDCLLPSNVGTVRDAITFVNSTTGTLTVVRGSGTAIYSNGTNGDLVIGPFSMRTIYKANAAGRWIA